MRNAGKPAAARGAGSALCRPAGLFFRNTTMAKKKKRGKWMSGHELRQAWKTGKLKPGPIRHTEGFDPFLT